MKNLTLIIPAKYEADSLPIFLDELKLVLKQNNFEVLLEKIVDKEFHIHSHTLEQILTVRFLKFSILKHLSTKFLKIGLAAKLCMRANDS